MKKMWALLAAGLLIIGVVYARAEEGAVSPAPAATNVTAAYPSSDTVLPAEPVPPAGGIKDYENFLKYADAVNAYIKAAQTYVDGATNDANDIINKRNEAVNKAQHVVDVYNAAIQQEEEKKEK